MVDGPYNVIEGPGDEMQAAAEALRIHTAQFGRNGISPVWENQPVGSVDQIVERLAPYLKLGYKHLIAGFSTPHDEESLIRFAEEVKPQLERA